MAVLIFTPSISGKTRAEVFEQNGYDLWNQHPSISQKRIFWSLHFTKNLKIDTCVVDKKNQNKSKIFFYICAYPSVTDLTLRAYFFNF
jgi:hypothetical protein